MSSFIVENQTIADLAETIAYTLNFSNNGFNIYLDKRELSVALMNCKKGSYYNEKKIADELYKMNDSAVSGRYNLNSTEIPDNFGKGENLILNNKFKLIKKLECYMYQCSEDATIETALYKALDKYLNSLYRTMIQQTPQYKECDVWG